MMNLVINIGANDNDGTSVLIKPATEVVADANGPYTGIVGETIQFTGSAIGGTEPYSWHWDFGDGTSTTQQNPTHAYTSTGSFTATLMVKDTYDVTDDDTAQISVNSHRPNKPSKPSGPTSGKAGTEYTYTSSTTDPDDDDVFYLFDWDDGTDSGWLGPYDSGDTVTASHTWTEKGDYQIKVKAKDDYDVESPWSDPLSVTMPRSKLFIHSLIEQLMERFPILYQIFQRFLQL